MRVGVEIMVELPLMTVCVRSPRYYSSNYIYKKSHIVTNESTDSRF